ncbi:MAG: hypothetical protein Q4D06_09175 [Coriobacteriia bacterium]|nr:hypothetical protein [Coriobacteriia bacterium]
MTQRNFQNARYQDETKPKGTTKKSASSFKPKTEAASSVYVAKGPSTKKEKKAANKERERLERKAESQANRESYNPTTERYKKLRMYWWIALGAAIVCLLISWLGRSALPAGVDIAFMIMSYVAIIGALYIDLGLIRRERKRWQEEQLNKKSKAQRRKEKEARIEAIKAEEAAREERRQNGGLFKHSAKKAAEAADTVVAKQQAAKEDDAK